MKELDVIEIAKRHPNQKATGKFKIPFKYLGVLSLSAGLMFLGFNGLNPAVESLSENKASIALKSTLNIVNVEAQPVELVTSYQDTRNYTGEIRAEKTSDLGFERGGKVVWLGVDEGEEVTKGQPLARLDISNLEAKKQQLLAKHAQARAVLAELKAGPRIEQIEAARANVKNLEQQLELERRKIERREYLYLEGAISREQRDESYFFTNALAARLEEAQSYLNELKTGTRPEKIEAQLALIEEIKANLADIEITIEKSTIKAPFNGIIAKRQIDEGTVARAEEPILRLVDNKLREGRIGVPPEVASQIQAGNNYQVTVGTQSYLSQVVSILPEVDPATRTQTVIVNIASSEPRTLATGAIVRLKLTQTVATSGYWLPITALVKGEKGLWSSYTVAEVNKTDKGGISLISAKKPVYKIETRDIEVLHTEGDHVLVRGTIQPQDLIISSGTQRIVPGQLVQLN